MTGGIRRSQPESQDRYRSVLRRWIRILAALAILSVATLTALTLDAYFGSSEVHPANSPVEWFFICIIAADLAVLTIRRYGRNSRWCRKFSLAIRRASHRTTQFLVEHRRRFARSVPWAVAAFALLWVPEYLVQPLWTDHEHMLVMARFWDHGDFPWRAMHTYQFPGGMETAWLSARLFGWGSPRGFYATNLAMISLAGFMMVAWARRNLGSGTYGFLGFLAMALVEAAQPFTNVAQRDSQTTWLAITALLARGAFPGHFAGSFVSAVALALAVAIRPHALIFVPIVASGLYREPPARGRTFREILDVRSRNTGFCLWIVAFVAAAGVFLSPILGPERTPAFLEAIEFPLTQPGDYSRGAFAAWDDVLSHSFSRQRNLLFLLFSVSMAIFGPEVKWRRLASVHLAIFAGVVIYRAAHPVDHGYMKLPMQFWTCLGAMIFPAWLMSKFRRIPTFTWLSILGGTVLAGMPSTPLFVSAAEWPGVVKDLAGIQPLAISPPGANHAYPRPPVEYHYNWTDWQAARLWIRENASESTRMLSLLSFHPFPSVLGTAGSLPIGRIESFVMLTWFKKFDFDSEIIGSLEAAPSGSLVIWDNERTNPAHRKQIARTSDYIRSHYVPVIRFGEFEIWKKP